MTIQALATGDTLVLSGRMNLPSDVNITAMATTSHVVNMENIVTLEVFQVLSSNAPAEAAPDTLQLHVDLPAGFLAHGPNGQLAAIQVQSLMSGRFPALAFHLPAFCLRRFTGISRLTWGVGQAPFAAYRYVLACDVAPEAEAELNQWYDDEHLPGLASVPGVQQARRDLCRYGSPRYRACYDVDHPDIVGCEAWLTVRHTPWTARMSATMRGVQRTMLKRVATVCANGGVSPSCKG